MAKVYDAERTCDLEVKGLVEGPTPQECNLPLATDFINALNVDALFQVIRASVQGGVVGSHSSTGGSGEWIQYYERAKPIGAYAVTPGPDVAIRTHLCEHDTVLPPVNGLVTARDWTVKVYVPVPVTPAMPNGSAASCTPHPGGPRT
jgi:hypothetical protein